MNYEILDISGDVGIRAYGKDYREVLVSAATGMYSLITDIDKVVERNSLSISVQADTLEGLIVRYLNELIFNFDTYGFVGRRIEIDTFEEKPENFIVSTTIYGEEFDPERHERRLLLKAATYHNINFQKVGDRYQIEVVFDI